MSAPDQSTQVELAKAEFRFRQDKETGYQRPTVEVKVPYPTAAALISILSRPANEDGKTDKASALIQDTVAGVLNNYLRAFVQENVDFSQETLDKMVEDGQVSIDYIANLARSSQNRITNDALEAFGRAFIKVAIEVQDDPELRVSSENGARTAAQAFVDRLRSAAGRNDILEKLEKMLERFTKVAPEDVLIEHQSTLEWLYVKLDEAKKKDEINLDNLD